MTDTAVIYTKAVSQSGQTPAFIQSGNSGILATVTSGKAGVTLSSATKAGSLLVLALGYMDNTTIATLAPTGWTIAQEIANTSPSPDLQQGILYRYAEPGETYIEVPVPTTCVDAIAVIGEFSGLGVAPLDRSVETTGGNPPTTGTLSETYEVVVAAAYWRAGFSLSFTTDAGWSAMGSVGSGGSTGLHSVYKLVGNATTAQDHGALITSVFGGDGACGCVSFTRSWGEFVSTTLRTVSGGETEIVQDITIANLDSVDARYWVLINDVAVFEGTATAKTTVQKTGFLPIAAAGTLKVIPGSSLMTAAVGAVRVS